MINQYSLVSFGDWSDVIVDTGDSMSVNFDLNNLVGPIRDTILEKCN